MRRAQAAAGEGGRRNHSAKLTLVESAIVWSAIALVAYLDADRHLVAQHAAVVGFIVAGISWIATALAAAAEVTVAYLATVVAWLAGRVADIFTSTGAMFARVWHWMEGFYGDVIKPSIDWLKAKFEALRAWLNDTMRPVLEYLDKVREEIRRIYGDYVRPVLDAIDVARAGLKVLADLGVEWAQKLDRVLGEVESWITENFNRVLGRLNQVIGVVNAVVTDDLLFRRVPMLRSLNRDAGAFSRLWWNMHTPPRGRYAKDKIEPPDGPISPDEAGQAVIDYLESGAGPFADSAEPLYQMLLEELAS